MAFSGQLLFSVSEEVLHAYLHQRAKGSPFVYSEQCELDATKLSKHLGQKPVASILLVASGSSFLWLDPEHGPTTVKLCRLLLERDCRLRFVVCPTTPSARSQWATDAIGLQKDVFRSFLPKDPQDVEVWGHFDPYRSVPTELTPIDIRKAPDAHAPPPHERGGINPLLSVAYGIQRLANATPPAVLVGIGLVMGLLLAKPWFRSKTPKVIEDAPPKWFLDFGQKQAAALAAAVAEVLAEVRKEREGRNTILYELVKRSDIQLWVPYWVLAGSEQAVLDYLKKKK